MAQSMSRGAKFTNPHSILSHTPHNGQTNEDPRLNEALLNKPTCLVTNKLAKEFKHHHPIGGRYLVFSPSAVDISSFVYLVLLFYSTENYIFLTH